MNLNLKVCTLYFNPYDNLLYSGSFDATTKVWSLNNLVRSDFKLASSFTLKGHEATVWCVLGVDKQGVMLTASADKTIKQWQLGADKRSADNLCSYTGHSDCVRGLALNLNNKQEFFSCSNDGHVIHWRLGQPTPLRKVYVTDSFLYSISMLNYEQNDSLRNPIDQCYFVTSSEDRSVRVHHASGKTGIATVQTLSLPCQTVWHAVCLPNGDLCAACSDGSIRVFTQREAEFATAQEQEEYERELAQFAIPLKADSALSQIDRNDLPGIEALRLPGRMEGQPLMINNNNEIEVYQWDSSASRWLKIGVAVGSSDAASGGSGRQKVTYLGKEYDYVFDIELDDTGSQKLKLPYNLTENPYLTAQEFIHKHELSQYFLDQIAQFIIKNTEGEMIGGGSSSAAYDPFTGENRYVPPASGGGGGRVATGGGVDPFTGSGAYTTGSRPPVARAAAAVGGGVDPFTGSSAYHTNVSEASNVSGSAVNEFYPHLSFIHFDQKNLEAIFKKLRELQQKIAVDVKSDLISDKSNIELLENLMNNFDDPYAANELNDQIDLLFQMIDIWPKGT
jgi:phospholipase A-2-activating protein